VVERDRRNLHAQLHRNHPAHRETQKRPVGRQRPDRTPTFTFDLAKRLILLIDVNETGIFHVTNAGDCTWFDLAQEIVKNADMPGVEVKPIKSTQFRSLAQRPAYSSLENKRLSELESTRCRPGARVSASISAGGAARARHVDSPPMEPET